MNNTEFNEICQALAYALQAEASFEDGDRCSIVIAGIDVLIELDEEADALKCYVDLGDPSADDRPQVCEQLLALNLTTHSNHHGAYAFESGSGRAIFCAQVMDASLRNAEELADLVRYYVEETEYARQLVASPLTGDSNASDHGQVFTGALV